ncbi:hypothetical protein D9757_008479 [Collybiopsis confluens]|uniref:Uncharacterized protein n=1 Tax=Collybiopsis confluens TaxID=2823264 RepID=A0A8H5M666_9AGAR|nr:hypothetical protein D9757_008479 [Collybiopsis confluens]
MNALLQHLHRKDPVIPLENIQSALAFHLGNASTSTSSLAATAITSPLFLSVSLARLQGLSNAFRHSVHLNKKIDVKALLDGLQGGHPILRLSAATGILLGLQDVKAKSNSRVSDTILIAFAEVLDQQEWETEFQQIQGPIPPLTLSLILACQSLPLIDNQRLRILPLSTLAMLLTRCIREVYAPDSKTAEHLQPHIPPLTRLLAKVLSLSITSSPAQGLVTAQQTLSTLRDLAKDAECDIPWLFLSQHTSAWTNLKTLLFTTVMISESIFEACIYLSPRTYLTLSSPSLSPSPFTLASTSLLTLSHLSLLVSQFGGISSLGSEGDGSFKELRRTAYLALDILASANGKGAVERFVSELVQQQQLPGTIAGNGKAGQDDLRMIHAFSKTSFTLSCIEQLIPVLKVDYLMGPVWEVAQPHLHLTPDSPSQHSRGSNDAAIDPLHSNPLDLDQLKRATFESAHSVVLAMFAASSNASASFGSGEKGTGGTIKDNDDMSLESFCELLVPFYSKCLIENSIESRLSTAQLCIAYPALVRSATTTASTSTLTSLSSPSPSTSLIGSEENAERFVVAWYCIQELLDIIHAFDFNPKSDMYEESERGERERHHRLHLVLISCVSTLPLALLGRVLDEIRSIIIPLASTTTTAPNSTTTATATTIATTEKENKASHLGDDTPRRTELIQSLYHQVLEMVGDREKEYVLRWWEQFVSDLMRIGLGMAGSEAEAEADASISRGGDWLVAKL